MFFGKPFVIPIWDLDLQLIRAASDGTGLHRQGQVAGHDGGVAAAAATAAAAGDALLLSLDRKEQLIDISRQGVVVGVAAENPLVEVGILVRSRAAVVESRVVIAGAVLLVDGVEIALVGVDGTVGEAAGAQVVDLVVGEAERRLRVPWARRGIPAAVVRLGPAAVAGPVGEIVAGILALQLRPTGVDSSVAGDLEGVIQGRQDVAIHRVDGLAGAVEQITVLHRDANLSRSRDGRCGREGLRQNQLQITVGLQQGGTGVGGREVEGQPRLRVDALMAAVEPQRRLRRTDVPRPDLHLQALGLQQGRFAAGLQAAVQPTGQQQGQRLARLQGQARAVGAEPEGRHRTGVADAFHPQVAAG